MQMNLDFTPPRVAMFRQALNDSPLVLLGGIEIRAIERMSFMVAPLVGQLRILQAPALQPAFLLVVGSTCLSVFRHNSGLEVVGEANNHVDQTAWHATCETLPEVGRQPAEAVRDLPIRASA